MSAPPTPTPTRPQPNQIAFLTERQSKCKQHRKCWPDCKLWNTSTSCKMDYKIRRLTNFSKAIRFSSHRGKPSIRILSEVAELMAFLIKPIVISDGTICPSFITFCISSLEQKSHKQNILNKRKMQRSANNIVIFFSYFWLYWYNKLTVILGSSLGMMFKEDGMVYFKFEMERIDQKQYPFSVCEDISSLRSSPALRWANLNSDAIFSHCVPFPLPGPPLKDHQKEVTSAKWGN